ncbi:phosphatidylserine decarboxylase [Glaciecola punicea ACAM 611]|uniref:Phosphatidylserine decarboxylase proenzyme n=1 Tax=Glaciecola punicea ACAM 611 TaxID=1121923 RepID=H5TEN1_9ALTE|nr:archaetidylserine decarboxylase [Glaciecola punicea]GAB56758.1 phosphatidylserine decarboxylase [Glaciecola punicea ACAM 611]
MIDWIKVRIQYILPKHFLSRLIGQLAAAEAGAVTQFCIKRFIKVYNINMKEALHEDPSAYKSFNDFFTRALKRDVRPIIEGDDILCQPVDGNVSQYGDIIGDKVFQAKSHYYSVTTLLGGKPEIAECFKGGKFVTIYLAPKDYHRIHMPIAGKLTDTLHVPGELFSVNPLTARNVPGLFARNERVVTIFDTSVGKVAVVLVGATVVASIETAWAGNITPPASKYVQHWQHSQDNITLEKGQEMGRFKLGSTVVLCFESDKISFKDLSAGDVTRLGEALAVKYKQKK